MSEGWSIGALAFLCPAKGSFKQQNLGCDPPPSPAKEVGLEG
jgi:hypothetical protein